MASDLIVRVTRDLEEFQGFALFAAAVEFGGISAASEALSVPKSRISRHIAALERRYGVQLIHRSSRVFAVTALGQSFNESCREMLERVDAARETIRRAQSQPRGPLRVSARAPLASQWLAPVLPRFLALYPEIEFELETSSKDVDLTRDRFDLAIRVQITPLDDSGVVIRRLGSSHSALVASPDLAARLGDISHPSHLAEAPRIGLMEPPGGVAWHLKGPDETRLTMRFVPRLATSEIDTLRAAAVGGAGIALLPLHYCRRELETGGLRRILPEWRGPINDIHAAYLSRRGLSACARSFVEFLIGEVPPGDGLAGSESAQVNSPRADRLVNSPA